MPASASAIVFEDRKAFAGRAPTEGFTVLLFTSGPHEQFAVPLAMLRRLVMVERDRIERVGDRDFITLDGVSVPVLHLDRHLPVSPAAGPGCFSLLPKNLSRPLGLLATSIIDTQRLPENFACEAFPADGVVGTAVIRGRMTLILDLPRLADLAEPRSRLRPRSQPQRGSGVSCLSTIPRFFSVN